MIEEKLFEIAEDESIKISITCESYLKLVNRGCRIIFNEDLKIHIKILENINFFLDLGRLREFIKICYQGGELEKSIGG
jgi:hypothetical protein